MCMEFKISLNSPVVMDVATEVMFGGVHARGARPGGGSLPGNVCTGAYAGKSVEPYAEGLCVRCTRSRVSAFEKLSKSRPAIVRVFDRVWNVFRIERAVPRPGVASFVDVDCRAPGVP